MDLQPRGLIGYHRITRRMSLIEGIFGKISHIVKNLLCMFRCDALRDTARNPLFFVSIYEILTFLGHYIRFFSST